MIYREAMKSPRADACEMMHATKNNPLFYQFFEAVRAGDPGLIHDCPYDVESVFFSLKGKFPFTSGFLH
jgi:hypothetical protein